MEIALRSFNETASNQMEHSPDTVRVIQTIAGLQRTHGGTSRSVPALSESLAQIGHDVHLLAGRPMDRSIESNQPAPDVTMHWIDEPRGSGRLLTGHDFRAALSQLAPTKSGTTVIHDHGLWLPVNHAVAQFSNQKDATRIVSPRGMLSPWAMNHRSWKKSLFWRLFQQNDLRSATAFHATSEMEANEIRSLGFEQPIGVIPNGIKFPRQMPSREKDRPRRCLFLSRIHPKKGLSLLLQAWKEIGPPPDWTLLIAGTDEKNYLRELIAERNSLGLENLVQFPGSVDDNEKWELYRSADLFVLPSFSENFGIVVAEALAAGLPVITTTGTPWQELHEVGAGWSVEPSANDLASALTQATEMPLDQLHGMGQNGSRWVQSQFQWRSVAMRMSRFYDWLAHGGPTPEFVR